MSNFEKYLPHLYELRERIIRCLLAYAAILIPLLVYSRELYTFAAQPILKTLPGANLIATQIVAPFTTPLKLALFICTLILVPYFLYHLWSFVKPGLYAQEKRTLAPLLFLSTSLFYLGVGFAHFVVCPLALHFFIHIAPQGVLVLTDMTHYLDFILSLYFGFGLAFQVPIITMLLCKMGLVSLDSLKRHRPYIIVGAFVVGMLLTPPDVISQCLLAIPLLGLFEAGLMLTKFLIPKPEAYDGNISRSE